MTAVFLAVIGGRLILPLLIPRWPLPAIIACLVLDEPPSLGQGLLASLAGDPAAQALAHHAAVRLALTRERWHTLGPDVRGYQVQVQVQKNKLGPSGQRVTIDIRFNGTVRGNGL